MGSFLGGIIIYIVGCILEDIDQMRLDKYTRL